MATSAPERKGWNTDSSKFQNEFKLWNLPSPFSMPMPWFNPSLLLIQLWLSYLSWLQHHLLQPLYNLLCYNESPRTREWSCHSSARKKSSMRSELCTTWSCCLWSQHPISVCLLGILTTPFLIKPPANTSRRQQMMVQAVGSLLPMWKTSRVLASTCPKLAVEAIWGDWTSEWEFSIHSLFPSPFDFEWKKKKS